MNRRFIWFVLALGWCMPALLVSAQERKNLSDGAIAKMIIGTWRFESGPKDPPLKMTMSFAKDHQCSTEGESLDINRVRHPLKMAGLPERTGTPRPAIFILTGCRAAT
jgi:hypothetical protein